MKSILCLNKKSLPLIILIIFLNSYNLFGQNAHVTRIKNLLDQKEATANRINAKKVYSHTINNLNTNASRSYTLDLKSSMFYYIEGVCDVDCSDIDMFVYNSNNSVVSKDIKPDDNPSISLRIDQAAKFKLEVKMIKCNASPCYYGFAVFGISFDDLARAVAEKLREGIVKELDKQKRTVSEQSGLRKTHDYIVGSLKQPKPNNPAKVTKFIELERGMVYTLAGVCDTDCTDLDMKVYYRDKVIASDSQGDDLPAVIVQPRSTGTYKVEITMYKCSRDFCLYGVGIFGK